MSTLSIVESYVNQYVVTEGVGDNIRKVLSTYRGGAELIRLKGALVTMFEAAEKRSPSAWRSKASLAISGQDAREFGDLAYQYAIILERVIQYKRTIYQEELATLEVIKNGLDKYGSLPPAPGSVDFTKHIARMASRWDLNAVADLAADWIDSLYQGAGEFKAIAKQTSRGGTIQVSLSSDFPALLDDINYALILSILPRGADKAARDVAALYRKKLKAMPEDIEKLAKIENDATLGMGEKMGNFKPESLGWLISWTP